ncbi:MAG: 4-hydroxythreonine-4-phosphate dehydrogenase PdxA [endosymbiont of Galathealinum brachiosum]|uniref:4-hydroxythreonine-4-phosphate dehydrogenase n=1 Tax=endosymbiont of Galathealinum brachiosum TaxID=2200906 RepID=A0A370D9V1_9GAMM|nr:MAG: 4-hydroxythreonine-4-phosphate dehydrogenase PdxA [endosymbiont of Galathealinum brachiosum]
MLPVIAITPGEPAGIGPDLAILTAQDNYDCNRVYFADPEMLHQRAQALGININIEVIQSAAHIKEPRDNTMYVVPVELASSATPGVLDKSNAQYVLECIRLAVESQQNNNTHALMTGPIHKGVINEAGIKFSGHTEYLAELSSGTPVMMLAAEAEKLRVALVTTHLPISQVSNAINKENLKQTISILHNDLQKKYGINKPHILVCGLNPHAGENGHMGMEEIETISPVLENMRQQGMNLTGPLPADTLFTPKYLKDADAVLAMYHDQGLPVLKHVGFGHAINITLGLSIIRTSVDHGTALDLAATTHIDNGSYIAALETAVHLANNQTITTAT